MHMRYFFHIAIKRINCNEVSNCDCEVISKLLKERKRSIQHLALLAQHCDGHIILGLFNAAYLTLTYGIGYV